MESSPFNGIVLEHKLKPVHAKALETVLYGEKPTAHNIMEVNPGMAGGDVKELLSELEKANLLKVTVRGKLWPVNHKLQLLESPLLTKLMIRAIRARAKK